ncbi:MAG: hypothetical protein Q7U14_04080, partial [Lacisediminimonas sp.]|nr:hypothetical protein [Lacisediminimonas sp.]
MTLGVRGGHPNRFVPPRFEAVPTPDAMLLRIVPLQCTGLLFRSSGICVKDDPGDLWPGLIPAHVFHEVPDCFAAHQRVVEKLAAVLQGQYFAQPGRIPLDRHDRRCCRPVQHVCPQVSILTDQHLPESGWIRIKHCGARLVDIPSGGFSPKRCFQQADFEHVDPQRAAEQGSNGGLHG